MAAIALLAGALAGRAWPSSSGTGAPGVTRVSIRLEPGQHLSGNRSMEDTIGQQRPSVTSFALSPDGRRLVYVASDGKTTRLFDRPLDRAHATPIAGTEGAAYVLFSPDGRSVAFSAGGQVRRVDFDTGEVRTAVFPALPGGVRGFSASWAPDDTILAASGRRIASVPSGGGTPTVLAEIAPGAPEFFFHPSPLPGGRTLLFNLGESAVPSEWNIAVQSLETGQRTVMLAGGSDPRYLPTGHLVFMRGGALLAVPFDLDLLKATGDPVVVVEDVMHADDGTNALLNLGFGQFSVSQSGTLAYVPGGVYTPAPTQLQLIDRSGTMRRFRCRRRDTSFRGSLRTAPGSRTREDPSATARSGSTT